MLLSNQEKKRPLIYVNFFLNFFQEEEARKKEQEEQERQAAAEAAAADIEKDEDSNNPETISADGKKGGKKKNQKKKKSANRNTKKKNSSANTGDLTAKVFATMEKHREVFFTIRLHSAQSAASLSPIVDPDNPMPCEMMDGRDAFLTMAREKHLEFSSLRRTKYSTMALLYELHTQGQDKFVYTCNNCSKSVETRYHCTQCDDFDLCIDCYKRDGHPHKMDRLGFDLGGDAGGGGDKTNGNPDRVSAIQRCIQSLVHACQCRDANCRLPSCHSMKRVVTHTRNCQRKWNGGCPICKKVIALCCYHAKVCSEAKCPVQFCQNIKQKLRHQQLQQRLQEAAMMRRRMAAMNARMNMGNSGASNDSAPPKPMPVQQQQPQQQQQQPQQQMPNASMKPVQNMNPHGGKPGTGPPNPGVLEAVKKVQEEANRTAQQSIGKNPQQVMVSSTGNPIMLQPGQSMQMQPQPGQMQQQQVCQVDFFSSKIFSFVNVNS